MLAATMLAACTPPAAPVAVPPVVLADLHGRATPVPDGSPLQLINVWATWCEPCRRELPALQCVHRRAAQVRVVGIAVDDDANLVREFVAERGITFPTLVDARGRVTREALDVRALPLTLVVDDRGNVLDRVEGARDWSGWPERPAGPPVSEATCGP